MKTRDHAKLAKYLIKNNKQKTSIYTYAFILGNISPDINVFTHISGHTTAGHTYEKSYCDTKKSIKKLMKKETLSIRDTYELGKIVHYITDYFTYSHNTFFPGKFREHNSYEKLLRKTFSDYLEEQVEFQEYMESQQIMQEKLLHYIELKHEEYENKRNTMVDDCTFILTTCHRLMVSLFNPKKVQFA